VNSTPLRLPKQRVLAMFQRRLHRITDKHVYDSLLEACANIGDIDRFEVANTYILFHS
jgi:hypothetical protein